MSTGRKKRSKIFFISVRKNIIFPLIKVANLYIFDGSQCLLVCFGDPNPIHFWNFRILNFYYLFASPPLKYVRQGGGLPEISLCFKFLDTPLPKKISLIRSCVNISHRVTCSFYSRHSREIFFNTPKRVSLQLSTQTHPVTIIILNDYYPFILLS